MSKLPYFNFYPSEWQNGDIDLLPFNVKGAFIDICNYYWLRDCKLTKQMLQQKLGHLLQQELNTLLEQNILGTESNGENLIISFLDEQFEKQTKISRIRQKMGRKGGLAKATAIAQAKALAIEQNRTEQNKIVENPNPKKNFKTYSEEDFIKEVKSFLEYSQYFERFINYWTEKDSKGKMKFQKQETWETKKRLTVWESRNLPAPSKQLPTTKAYTMDDYLNQPILREE